MLLWLRWIFLRFDRFTADVEYFSVDSVAKPDRCVGMSGFCVQVPSTGEHRNIDSDQNI